MGCGVWKILVVSRVELSYAAGGMLLLGVVVLPSLKKNDLGDFILTTEDCLLIILLVILFRLCLSRTPCPWATITSTLPLWSSWR